jgi:hypothetical protein
MGTRGCVAVQGEGELGASFRGVYNHFDSYPMCLGKEVWDRIQECGADAVANGLLKHGDWQAYLAGGMCEYCGKEAGQPVNISGVIFGWEYRRQRYATLEAYRESFHEREAWKGREDEVERQVQLEAEIRQNEAATGYPDPESKYHSHRGAEDQITSEYPNPLFIEWVYVIEPATKKMVVLYHVRDPLHPEGSPILDEEYKRPDGFWEYGHCAYRHELMAVIDLDGSESDWGALKKRIFEERDAIENALSRRA